MLSYFVFGRARTAGSALVLASAFAAACDRTPRATHAPEPPRVAGDVYVVRDTVVTATFDAAGVAAPLQQATLSTKLMGSVTEVLVKEGDVVSAGQPLVRIDARDLAAKESQIAASISEASAVQRDAAAQATRIRALYADSAASRAQLDAMEAALARADAGVRAAHAAADELTAVSAYAVVRAPFAGIVTKRFADPGTFASPGTPLLSVMDASRLRITAAATPEVASVLRRGQPIEATIESHSVRAVVEGVVPAPTGNLYTVNAIVANDAAATPMLAGSTASLSIPTGRRAAMVVPSAAIVREGDLTGVTVRAPAGDETRWVRLGRETRGLVEVSSGLRDGDVIVVPRPREITAAGTVGSGGN